MRLSDRKNLSFERKVRKKLATVNRLKSNFSLGEFNKIFSGLSAIWKIFLLHCIRPNIYPIFDQHVFRAMMFILDKTIHEVSKSEKEKYDKYFSLYVPFFNELVRQSDCDPIKVDHALWVFGKALKSPIISDVLMEDN